MKSYVLDKLVKYHCFNCNSEFILSEYKIKKAGRITCPYCQSKGIQSYVCINDKDKLNKLGCIAMGHHEDPEEERVSYEMTWGRIEREREK